MERKCQKKQAFYNDDMCGRGNNWFFSYRIAITNHTLLRVVKIYEGTTEIEADKI